MSSLWPHTLRGVHHQSALWQDKAPLFHRATMKYSSCFINPVLINLLPDINFALRKIVCLLSPRKEITHDPASGDMRIRTLTTFKNFNMEFTIGTEFTEDLGPVDGRTCQVCLCVVVVSEYAVWLVWTRTSLIWWVSFLVMQVCFACFFNLGRSAGKSSDIPLSLCWNQPLLL